MDEKWIQLVGLLLSALGLLMTCTAGYTWGYRRGYETAKGESK